MRESHRKKACCSGGGSLSGGRITTTRRAARSCFACACRVCRSAPIKGLPARVTPLTPAGGVMTIVEVLRPGPRSWAPVSHRNPKGLVYKRAPVTILRGSPARPVVHWTDPSLLPNRSRGPRPSGTESHRNWGFFPTGLFDPVTMTLPGVRITKPRGRALTA